ncbi:MAG: hypothetical protein JO047_14815 [Alphaproteobacteria bacterium]|nr:hypothetical protein [Alphaproteobacteria bacterium]
MDCRTRCTNIGVICIGAALVEVGWIPVLLIGIVVSVIPSLRRFRNDAIPILCLGAAGGRELDGAETRTQIRLLAAPPSRGGEELAAVGLVVRALLPLELPLALSLALRAAALIARLRAETRRIGLGPAARGLLAGGNVSGEAIAAFAARALLGKLAGHLLAGTIGRIVPQHLAPALTRLLTATVSNRHLGDARGAAEFSPPRLLTAG